MATFVLVHPAWMGGWCWSKVAAQLRELGHEAYAPTLTGLGERSHLASRDVGLSTHIADVESVLVYEDLRDVTLVGSSSAGTVITGVADSVPERLSSLVHLDAFLPSHGQCTLDLMPADRRQTLEQFVASDGEGWLLPRLSPAPWPAIVRGEIWQLTEESDVEWLLPRPRPTPFRHFTDPVRLAPPPLQSPRPRLHLLPAQTAGAVRPGDTPRAINARMALPRNRHPSRPLHHPPQRGDIGAHRDTGHVARATT